MKKLIAFVAALFASAATFAATTVPVQFLNPTGSTAGQAVVSTGASSAPAWGNVSATSLAAIAANSVLANATASGASPTAFTMPSCSASTSALGWASGTGFVCNAAINAAALGGATFAAPGAIGSTTPGSGAFTTLSASGTVSGTGFSTYLASPPAIGTTTPAAGAFTSLGATGAITPSQTAGIVGTTTNNNANAGSVGEFVSATQGSAVSLTNSVISNITSISLTAGDWDVSGAIAFAPANTTTVSNLTASISLTSGAIGGLGSITGLSIPFTSSGASTNIPTPVVRISIAATTTVYLTALSGFGTSTMTATGTIRARRVR